MPTRNAAEGFAALLALDPGATAADNAADDDGAGGRAIQTLQVTEAVRDAKIGGRKVRKGQTIVLDPDDGLVAADGDRDRAVLAAVATLAPGFELITLLLRRRVRTSAEAEDLRREIGRGTPRRRGRDRPRRPAALPVPHLGGIAVPPAAPAPVGPRADPAPVGRRAQAAAATDRPGRAASRRRSATAG